MVAEVDQRVNVVRHHGMLVERHAWEQFGQLSPSTLDCFPGRGQVAEVIAQT
jgi:hypothetical protein